MSGKTALCIAALLLQGCFQPNYIDTDGREVKSFPAKKCNSYDEVVLASIDSLKESGYWVSVSEVNEKNRVIVGRKKSLTNYKTVIEVKEFINPVLSASPEYLERYGNPQNQITIQSWHENKSKISKAILGKLKSCDA